MRLGHVQGQPGTRRLCFKTTMYMNDTCVYYCTHKYACLHVESWVMDDCFKSIEHNSVTSSFYSQEETKKLPSCWWARHHPEFWPSVVPQPRTRLRIQDLIHSDLLAKILCLYFLFIRLAKNTLSFIEEIKLNEKDSIQPNWTCTYMQSSAILWGAALASNSRAAASIFLQISSFQGWLFA